MGAVRNRNSKVWEMEGGGEGNFRSVISREKASSVKYHVPYPLIVLFVCSLFVPRRRLMLVCRPMFHFFNTSRLHSTLTNYKLY